MSYFVGSQDQSLNVLCTVFYSLYVIATLFSLPTGPGSF
jgi:hypothetical protein